MGPKVPNTFRTKPAQRTHKINAMKDAVNKNLIGLGEERVDKRR